MLVSISIWAAPSVEFFPGPASLSRSGPRPCRFAGSLSGHCLIKYAQTRFGVELLFLRPGTRGYHADGFSGFLKTYIISWPDPITLGNCFWHRYLQFTAYFSHILTLSKKISLSMVLSVPVVVLMPRSGTSQIHYVCKTGF